MNSIRTRLLLVYVGILFVGFIALTVIAGQQISLAARADYEQRIQTEIRLIAQGIRTHLNNPDSTNESLNDVIAQFEAQTGGELVIIGPEERGRAGQRGQPPQGNQPAEVETAMRGEVIVVERDNALYTAASISERPPVIVQLRVLTDNLQALVWQRWASLGLVFGLVTVVALIAATMLAQSMIRPLYALRHSAQQLSQGDFSHRVDYRRQDEIGEVAQAFNEMARQVESMLEEQRAFASNTSHELRTPLTTIRLRSEALRYEETLDDETAKQYIAEIDDEVMRLSTLIEDLTLLSRFDAGRAEPGESQIDMSRFAANLQQRMQPHADLRNIRISVMPEEIQPVHASLNHLTVVFRNLLDNAIKYTPDGGKITWVISAGVDGICSIITDTGRGIEPDQLPRLFERFYRADRARSRDIPGTGLGLAIVKSIVEAYGGSVSIESEGSGKGTTVTVFWPYRPKTA